MAMGGASKSDWLQNLCLPWAYFFCLLLPYIVRVLEKARSLITLTVASQPQLYLARLFASLFPRYARSPSAGGSF